MNKQKVAKQMTKGAVVSKHKKLLTVDNRKTKLSPKLVGVRNRGVMYAKSGDTPISRLFDGFLGKLKK